MRPSNMTSTRSERARISLELRRDEEHRSAGVALDDEPLMDVFGRADVEAARRLLGYQHWRFVRTVRAQRRPSAGCRPRAFRRPRARSRIRIAYRRMSARACSAIAPRIDEEPPARAGHCAGSPLQDCRRRWLRAPSRRRRDPPGYRRGRRLDARRHWLRHIAPRISIRPPSGLPKPTSASMSSFWPLPATPATRRFRRCEQTSSTRSTAGSAGRVMVRRRQQ